MPPKPKTFEEVQSFINKTGHNLLSKDYKGCYDKLEIRCPSDHTYLIRWTDFQKGSRCNICSKKFKKSIGFIEKYAKKFGDTLLSTHYKNAFSKLEFICAKGHKFVKTWASYSSGCRCSECKLSEKRSKMLFKAKAAIEKEGYKLLTNSYIKNTSTLVIQCNLGHVYSSSWAAFNNGNRCSVCNIENRKNTLDKLKEYAVSKSHNIISDNYENYKSILTFECYQKHVYKRSWHDFLGLQGCPICHFENKYVDYKHGKAFQAIVSKNHSFAKKQKISLNYPNELLKAISQEIELIYKQCKKGYHVDHIIPISWFNLANPIELEYAWSPENLRVLKAEINLSKGNKRTKMELLTLFLQEPKLIKVFQVASRKPSNALYHFG